MQKSAYLGKHLFNVYNGGNWSWANVKDILGDVTWNEANKKLGDCNTILTIAYHFHYYIVGIEESFQREELITKDKYSFDCPIDSEKTWALFKEKIFVDIEKFVGTIKALSDEKMDGIFFDTKYGSTMSNILGLIEHVHYHLGQIVILKKLLRSQ